MDVSPQTSNLYQLAIDAALDLNWEEALKLNKKIIKLDPTNVDALNRQAKAYMELGKCNLAKKYYSQVLKYDPYNPIAQKNLKIMKSFKFNGQAFTHCSKDRLSPSSFLQEPGKTKVVNLLKVAEPQKLSHVFCGMKVIIATKNRKITISDAGGNYLGALPDDTSHLLLRLIRGGNKYDLFVKSISVNSVSVIIKETFRSKRFKNQPSFLAVPLNNTASILSSLDDVSGDEESEEDQENQEV